MGWSDSAIADEDKLQKGEGQQVLRRVWRMLRPCRGRIVRRHPVLVGPDRRACSPGPRW